MTDRDVVERVAEVLGRTAIHVPARRSSHKDVWQFCLRGRPAANLMFGLRDHLGARRRQQVCTALGNLSLRGHMTTPEILRFHETGTVPTWWRARQAPKVSHVRLQRARRHAGAAAAFESWLSDNCDPGRPESHAWAAGLWEGEGCFPRYDDRARAQLQMIDLDVMERLRTIVAPSAKLHKSIPKDVGWSPTYRLTLCGQNALDIGQWLSPLLGERRQAAFRAMSLRLQERDAATAVRRRAGRVANRRGPFDASLVAAGRRHMAETVLTRWIAGDEAPAIAADLGVTRQTVYQVVWDADVTRTS